jgi:hypothetical protein
VLLPRCSAQNLPVSSNKSSRWYACFFNSDAFHL